MSGHGSPPPVDRANHPNRQVARLEGGFSDPNRVIPKPNSKGSPMARMQSHSRSINRIEAEAGGTNIPTGHHLYKQRAKHIALRDAARADFRKEQGA